MLVVSGCASPLSDVRPEHLAGVQRETLPWNACALRDDSSQRREYVVTHLYGTNMGRDLDPLQTELEAYSRVRFGVTLEEVGPVVGTARVACEVLGVEASRHRMQFEPTEALVGARFTVQLDALGGVERIEGEEEAIQRVLADPRTVERLSLGGDEDEDVRKAVKAVLAFTRWIFVPSPRLGVHGNEQLEPGQTWADTDGKRVFTYLGITRDAPPHRRLAKVLVRIVPADGPAELVLPAETAMYFAQDAGTHLARVDRLTMVLQGEVELPLLGAHDVPIITTLEVEEVAGEACTPASPE